MDFALRLLFLKWNFLHVVFTGLGIGGAIIGHIGMDSWGVKDTAVLITIMVLITMIAKCISFAYSLYEEKHPKIFAKRFVKGDGINIGNTIIVLSTSASFSKGQLLTLFCESSGARQPILLMEITASNENEIQAVSIAPVEDHEIRKYFEEESRRKMLFATSEVNLDNLKALKIGGSNV